MLLGWSVMNVQQTKCEKCEKACITLKEFENASAFSNCTERKDMHLSRWPCTLFASLSTAALSHTHPSRRRLRGIEAAFTVCLLHFRARLLALSSSLPSQLLPFWRCDNETTSTATALRMMNLLAFLSVTNCIPECDKLLFWAWQIAFPSVTNCVPEYDTTPPPTKNMHCKISNLALRHSAIRSLVLWFNSGEFFSKLS